MQQKKIASVTVIIPCYRCTKSIWRAVNSVIEQTLMPAEIILIDDNSGDNTLDLLISLENAYPNLVKVISLSKNVGAAFARNNGWAKATQSYVAFLDSDDTWHPRKIEIQYAFMIANPTVVLCGHAHHIQKQDCIIADVILDNWYVEKISKRALLFSNKFITPSVMIKSNISQRFISEQRYMEDHMLWLSVVFSGSEVVKLSARLASIYKDSFGTSGLSSHMCAMEKSELGNYWMLCKAKNIGFTTMVVLSFYSVAKFIRRLIIASLRHGIFARN